LRPFYGFFDMRLLRLLRRAKGVFMVTTTNRKASHLLSLKRSRARICNI
jgi:hypothetical protein